MKFLPSLFLISGKPRSDNKYYDPFKNDKGGYTKYDKIGGMKNGDEVAAEGKNESIFFDNKVNPQLRIFQFHCLAINCNPGNIAFAIFFG